MASVDMCEHDWPGTGCKECFPKKFVNYYRVPYVIIPITVLEFEGKFYSFPHTIRSAQSIWDEVKYSLSSLKEMELDEAEKEEMKEYFVDSFQA